MNASSGSGLCPKRSTWVASTRPPGEDGRDGSHNLANRRARAQAREHPRMRAARERLGRLGERKEARVGSVVTRAQASAGDERAVAEKEHAAAARSPAAKAPQEFGELDREAGLFARFAHRGLVGRLSDLEKSAGQGPRAL